MDALFYIPCCMLFRDRQHTKTAAMMLKMLGEEGHVLSNFTVSVFSLFNIPELKEEGMQQLIQIVKSPGMCSNVPNWIYFLAKMTRTWNPFHFKYDDVRILCNKEDRNNCYNIFDHIFWPVLIQDLANITCLECKVAVVLYNFCNQI